MSLHNVNAITGFPVNSVGEAIDPPPQNNSQLTELSTVAVAKLTDMIKTADKNVVLFGFVGMMISGIKGAVAGVTLKMILGDKFNIL